MWQRSGLRTRFVSTAKPDFVRIANKVAKEDQCKVICEDGSRCVLHENHTKNNLKYKLKDSHVSEFVMEAGKIRGQDRTRPFHFKSGKPLKVAELKAWKKIPLVPLFLEFDDGDMTGQRVSGWVREEDLWRFIPE